MVTLPHSLALCLLLTLFPMAGIIHAQGEYTAMIPPFHDREHQFGTDDVLQLTHQGFVLFVYRNAVAVYTEADFVNTGPGPLVHELALPSTGHDENGDAPGGRISNGIRSVQLWVEGERAIPDLETDGDNVSWYTIRAAFKGYEHRKVKGLFWAQTLLTSTDEAPGLDTTSIAAGERGFVLDLCHAAVWKSNIDSLDVTVVLHDGLDMQGATVRAKPETYESQGATLLWHMNNVEPSLEDNIAFYYTAGMSATLQFGTMAGLSRFITHEGYDELVRYVRDAGR
jgi:hypothetical protein